MIKGNESDVANIEFELQAKTGDKFVCVTLFRNIKELPILGTRCLIAMGWNQTVAF